MIDTAVAKLYTRRAGSSNIGVIIQTVAARIYHLSMLVGSSMVLVSAVSPLSYRNISLSVPRLPREVVSSDA